MFAVLSHYTLFLQYLTNVEYPISSRSIMSQSTLTIPSNFAYVWT